MLLTFTGFHDPYSPGPVAGREEEGPVLSLIRGHPVDKVLLLSTPNTLELTDATKKAIIERHPAVEVEIRHVALRDPTDYLEILTALRAHFAEVLKAFGKAKYFVGTASGTPQMHASWVLLVASGEIPARILHTRPARFVTAGKAEVIEVDPTRPEFPTIRPRMWREARPEGEGEQDSAAVIEGLGIVGDHPALSRSVEMATLLARADVPVFILGESGTGKEKFAALIHGLSDRASRPFVPVNCAAIPGQLAESTLFGHKKGAFTGAASELQGKFEVADGGTLFLDEIADLPLEVQGKLLRAVQHGVIEPLGVAKGKKVNVRLIAATNRDIGAAIEEGKFREDLYFRLRVGEIRLPALRERRSDISRLAFYFLDQINPRLRKPRRLSPEALGALQRYDWPGNVRELENTVHRAALLSRDDEIRPEHLELGGGGRRDRAALPDLGGDFSLEEYINETRARLIERALDLAGGNQSEAARLLGISPQAVNQWVRSRGETKRD